MNIKIVANGYYPVVQSKGELLCFKRFSLYRFDGHLFSKIASFKVSLLRRFLSHFRLFERRFGLNEIKGVRFSDGAYFLFFHHHLFILKDRSLVQLSPDSFDILHLSLVGQKVYWGDYGYNPLKKEKRIISYDYLSNTIRTEHVFGVGEINHIHKIIENPNGDGFLIFTGDFGDSSAIYRADPGFTIIEPIRFGDQIFRSCCGIAFDNLLTYATDTPFQENYLISLDLDTLNCLKIASLDGSVIYSLFDYEKEDLYFSSTVENETDELNNRRNKYKYNLGKGIKGWKATMYRYSLKTGILSVVAVAKKDFLPMIPFKYGCFRFPYYCGGDLIYSYGQSIKKYDGKLIVIENEEKC